MIPTGSLVVFKDRAARVASCAEGRISLELETGETKKVREKDVVLVHRGPLNRMPDPREGGDFETAHAMLTADYKGREPIPTSWSELCELVFGDYSPDAALACLRRAAQGDLFKIGPEGPLALSPAEIDYLRQKNEAKLQERSRRAAFAAAMRQALRNPQGGELRSRPEFSRSIAELEAFALGGGEGCPAAAESGIKETREAVHQALIDTGLWEPCFNPWPARSGCLLNPPRRDFPERAAPCRGGERKDLRHIPSFAIDQPWSHDPDDAIGFDGEFVWVHVADPAAFVVPGSPVDEEALARGASLYLPEKTVPMLPAAAVQRLGLGLEENSPALSFGIRLSAEGLPLETIIAPSLARVVRLDYEKADVLLNENNGVLSVLEGLAALRRARRLANGAVDIDFPEVAIQAENGEPRFLPIASSRSAQIVREMMLLAGEAAGRWAQERALPFPYSSQEAPQLPETLPRYDEKEKLLSAHYQRRKGMRASIVGVEPLAHRGLGLSFYSQVTSPLRRYQDLLAHYQIRAFLAAQNAGKQKAEKLPELLSADELSRRCLLSSLAAASTRQAERDSRLHWAACFLFRNPGWKGEAIVLEARSQDAWVFLPALGLETSLRTRKKLSPDETIEVAAVWASIPTQEVNFDIV